MRCYILPLALLFIAFSAPSIAQKSDTGEVVVQEGAPLSVECVLRVEQRAAWRVDGAAPAPDLRAAGERPLGAGRLLARLQAPAARARHAGLYSCHADAEPVRVRVLPLPAPIAAVGEASTTATELGQPDEHDFPVNVVYFNLYHPYQFNCTMSGVTSYKWTRNGTAVTGSEEKGPKLVEDGAILALSRMHESDHGNYTCRADGKLVVAWEARGRPLARVPFDTNVVEGQTVTITCKLIGRPYTNVTWTYRRSGEENATAIEVGAADGRFSAKDSAAGVPGGELQLRAAELGDAGEYACVPEHGTPAATTLRVKDVYAALWPFLGICLEVFILCAIILVYEKRRTKPELDDSDADTHDQ